MKYYLSQKFLASKYGIFHADFPGDKKRQMLSDYEELVQLTQHVQNTSDTMKLETIGYKSAKNPIFPVETNSFTTHHSPLVFIYLAQIIFVLSMCFCCEVGQSV